MNLKNIFVKLVALLLVANAVAVEDSLDVSSGDDQNIDIDNIDNDNVDNNVDIGNVDTDDVNEISDVSDSNKGPIL
jgi:hypothetical protein